MHHAHLELVDICGKCSAMGPCSTANPEQKIEKE